MSQSQVERLKKDVEELNEYANNHINIIIIIYQKKLFFFLFLNFELALHTDNDYHYNINGI